MQTLRFIRGITMLFLCLTCLMIVAKSYAVELHKELLPFEIVSQMPDLISSDEAEPIDHTFMSDIAFLAPSYGAKAGTEIFYFKNPGQLHSTPAVVLIISSAKKAKGSWPATRAIVQMPILCAILKQQNCTTKTLPNGMWQFTKLDNSRSFEGVIRFPLLPNISVRFQDIDKKRDTLRLWITDSETGLIHKIDLFGNGSGGQEAMPVLQGISAELHRGLPSSRFERIEDFDEARNLKITNTEGTILAKILISNKTGSGYGKIFEPFCTKFAELEPKLNMCNGETRISYFQKKFEYQSDQVSQNVRLELVLRQPNSTYEVVFIGYKHGMNPSTMSLSPQLEGFVFVENKAPQSSASYENAIFDLKFIDGEKVEGLLTRDQILGHSFGAEGFELNLMNDSRAEQMNGATQNAMPPRRLDPNWSNRFSPDIAYYNRGNGGVAIYSDENATNVIDELAPNDGGFIKACALNTNVCETNFGRAGKTGWVDMESLSGEAL